MKNQWEKIKLCGGLNSSVVVVSKSVFGKRGIHEWLLYVLNFYFFFVQICVIKGTVYNNVEVQK